MPQRKIANNAFIILSMLAGCDTLMIDPVQTRPKDFVDFKLASDLMLGLDENALRYMTAFRTTSPSRTGRPAPRTGAQ